MSSETLLPGPDASVTLREITSDTLQSIIDLKVSPEQEQFVAANVVSIAQAYFYRDILWFRAIYADEIPVGFVMVAENPAEQEWFLSRLMIDARYQGRGYGERALQLVIDGLRSRGATELQTSCGPGEGSPCPFYERRGFVDTGDFHGKERVLRLLL
ncbi:MAG TPA: GNAT family N-acetyltransferase [Herpetosiphonaceae bacterium]